MCREIRVTTVLLLGLLLLSSGVTWAGPMIFSGDDADSSNHCEGTRCGGLYAKALKAVYDASKPGTGVTGNRILAIMSGSSSTALTALNGWNSVVNGGPGAAITFVTTTTTPSISTVDFSQYRMIYVPSASNLTTGGITSIQVSALNLRKTAIQAFVNSGGGVLALSEQGLTGAFGWLPVPLTFATITDTNVQPTPDMFVELPATTGSVTDANMDHSQYHNSWSGTFGDLKVLAITKRTTGINVPVIVGRITPVNTAPTNILLSNNTIAENAGANAAVGTLSTTDVDVGDTFTYTLVAGTGDTGNGSFNISGASLRATASLNFETTPSLSVRVRSTDAGGLFTEKQFTISVTNVNEAPTDIALSNSSVAENAGANAAVGTLSTTDVDVGDTFTYTLVAGTGDTGNGSFNISGASLRATASLNFETTPSLSVRVRSTDAGGLFTEKQFTISVTNVNEAPTDIALSNSSVAENAGANAAVGNLSTTDPDTGDTFTYTLVAGAGDTGNGSFNISGASLRATASLDFEATPSLSVRVRSTDAGGLFTEKAFTITVTNVTEPAVDLAVGFNFPFGVAVDADGNVYIADRNNHVVKKLSGGTLTVVAGCSVDSSVSPPVCAPTPAGTGDEGYNGDNISATAAQLNSPTGVAVDASGNLFIADSQNHIIRKVTGGTITTVAGTPGISGLAVNGGAATLATLFGPRGVAVDAAGNIYIADNMNQQIRKVDGSTGNILAVAGVAGVAGYNGDGIDPTTAQLNSPLGVAVDVAGNIYIADEGNDRIRAVFISDGLIHTVDTDPVAVEAPAGVAVDGDGTLYIADTNHHQIVRVFGETVDVVAGTGTAGSGPGELNTPVGVAVKADGSVLYIADLINNRIEEVDF
jgi:sugar lactone lactonase YvrE